MGRLFIYVSVGKYAIAIPSYGNMPKECYTEFIILNSKQV